MTNWTSTWQAFLDHNPELNPGVPLAFAIKPALLPAELAQDEAFWQQVKSLFPQPANVISLNSGAVSAAPLLAEEAFMAYYRLINHAPSYYLLGRMDAGRELIRAGLAGLINAAPDEIALLRNTSEAANNAIFGLPLAPGDEVVACRQDYSKVVAAWQQRELREGIVIRWVDLAGPAESDAEVVAKYATAMTERTRIVSLTHVINWSGQVMPVAAIIAEAKRRHLPVLLDGAHSLGLLEVDVQALSCDYFVGALHKWLAGPVAGGLLYVKQDRIAAHWPLAGSATPHSDNIRKFEELSMQLQPVVLSLGYALALHEWLGRDYKEARLRYLRRGLQAELAALGGVHYLTPREEERCCALLNLTVAGTEPAALEQQLLQRFNIHVGVTNWANIRGLRVTPNVYTSPAELSQLAQALKQLAAPAVPAPV